jgi:hypothetical protein
MNIEHRTSNETGTNRFGVRRSMFDVCPPIANQPGGFAPGVESSPNLL